MTLYLKPCPYGFLLFSSNPVAKIGFFDKNDDSSATF